MTTTENSTLVYTKSEEKNRSYFLNCLRNIPMFILRFASKMETWEREKKRLINQYVREEHTMQVSFLKMQQVIAHGYHQIMSKMTTEAMYYRTSFFYLGNTLPTHNTFSQAKYKNIATSVEGRNQILLHYKAKPCLFRNVAPMKHCWSGNTLYWIWRPHSHLASHPQILVFQRLCNKYEDGPSLRTPDFIHVNSHKTEK